LRLSWAYCSNRLKSCAVRPLYLVQVALCLSATPDGELFLQDLKVVLRSAYHDSGLRHQTSYLMMFPVVPMLPDLGLPVEFLPGFSSVCLLPEGRLLVLFLSFSVLE
jgi:hypothetical protein